MLRPFQHRAGHYCFLILIAVPLFFFKLGSPSLWDVDEGHNAETAREMLVSGNWIVPTFNFRLRTDKPALLYWLQIVSYQMFGVNEFSARLPSAVASVLAVLVTYELGRRMFQASTGALAGVILASTVLFCAAAHFANPDAILLAFSTLSFWFFWRSFAAGTSSWFVPAGICTGFAVLAKGPVGVVLPLVVSGLFLLWNRQLSRLWQRGLIWGILAFSLTVVPWYAWVSAETKFVFLQEFLYTHNTGRFTAPMEGHGGPVFYYLICLIVGFAPWSAFLVPVCWAGMGKKTQQDADFPNVHAYRFLWCWVFTYLAFFSVSGTKLPNYILPIYPALAILTARFLDRWRRQTVVIPGWLMNYCLVCLALVGIAFSTGLALAGGMWDMLSLGGRKLPGLGQWAIIGAVPLLGALAGWWSARHRQPVSLIASSSIAAALFIGSLGVWGSGAVAAYKAAKPLADALKAHQSQQEIRIGCYHYYQPSLVFYCRQEVIRLQNEEELREFLQYPMPIYLFVPAKEWMNWQTTVPGSFHVLDRHYDLYQGEDILIVANY